MQSEPHSIKTVVIAYLFKYLKDFKSNLEKAMEEYDQDAIHEYRVAVKRIRAITQALNKIYSEPLFSADLIMPLRIMFKAGGSIRDDQVQIDLVEELEKANDLAFPLIKEFYLKKIESQRTEFFLKSVDFDYTELAIIAGEFENAIDTLDEAYLETNLYQRLHRSMEKLKIARYDIIEPTSLHRFRRKFKENGYIAEMLFHSKFSHKISPAVYSRMKNFGQELGSWHDHFQLWTKTAHIFEQSKEAALLEESLKLRIFITPIHDKLFQEILHQIKRDETLFNV